MTKSKKEFSMIIKLTYTNIVGGIVTLAGLATGVLAYVLKASDFSFPVVCITTGMSAVMVAKAANTSSDNAKIK